MKSLFLKQLIPSSAVPVLVWCASPCADARSSSLSPRAVPCTSLQLSQELPFPDEQSRRRMVLMRPQKRHVYTSYCDPFCFLLGKGSVQEGLIDFAEI